MDNGDLRNNPEKYNKALRKINPALVPETAVVEASCDEWIKEGDEVVVQYLIATDDQFDIDKPIQRNPNFMYTDENGDEIRWCDTYSLYGRKRGDEIIPMKGYVFCSLPEVIAETKTEAGIILLEKKQDTDRKAFKTTIVFIHPEDAEMYDLSVGDEVFVDKDSDAVKKIFGHTVIRVLTDKVLALA